MSLWKPGGPGLNPHPAVPPEGWRKRPVKEKVKVRKLWNKRKPKEGGDEKKMKMKRGKREG